MTPYLRSLAAGLAALLLVPAGPARLQAQSFNTNQRSEIEQIVKEYLLSHPELLQDVMAELEKRQTAAEEERHRTAVKENGTTIFASPYQVTLGNPQGEVTLVEFFDYNCGFCKRALPDVVKLAQNDNKVRLVLKELPIFGEESEGAAKVALASAKQGKYFEMYQKLFTEPGKADKNKALRIAGELGLDKAQLEKDIQDPEIQKSLDEAKELANKLGLQGTPLFLIGDRSIPGAPDDLYDQLTKNVAEVREKGCKATC